MSGFRDRDPQQEQKSDGEGSDGKSGRPGDLGIDARQQQRPCDDTEGKEGAGPDGEQRQHLVAGDAEEAPEQQAGEPVQVAVVQAHEQEPAGKCHRLHRSDQSRLLAVRGRSRPGVRLPDHDRRHRAHPEVPEGRGNPEQDGPRGSGETDQRKGVPGEGLTAEHHEPPHHAGHDGHDGPGTQRVHHERVAEELADAVHGVTERGGRHGRRVAPARPPRPAGHPTLAGLRPVRRRGR